MSVIGRIAPGPAVARFASAVAVDVTEVCDWMNDYIHNHANWQGLGDLYEPTEAERLEAIKNYVAGQV